MTRSPRRRQDVTIPHFNKIRPERQINQRGENDGRVPNAEFTVNRINENWQFS
jgi:hypothetical protein